MSAKVMGMVFDAQGLTPTQKLLLLALADHGNERGESIYPSVARLCDHTALSERTVRKTLSELRGMELLIVVRKNSRYNTTLYTLNIKNLSTFRPAPDAPLDESDLHVVHTRPAPDAARPARSAVRPAPDAPDSLINPLKQPKQEPKEALRPPAVEAYRLATGFLPNKTLWESMDEAVGREPDNVSFWQQVAGGWVAKGWNPRNVSGMYDFFKRKEIPGSKNGQSQGGASKYDSIRAWANERSVKN